MSDTVDTTSGETGVLTSPFITALQTQRAEWVADTKQALGETTITVPRESIVEICTWLKTASGFECNMLADLCGVDRGIEVEPRFEVNYHLFSTIHKHRVRLKVLLSDSDPQVETVTGVWRTANWHERETYDLMGIIFDGHPDLRRILMPDDETGHPLRKDYPLRGYEPYSLT
ncbi:MAG: NADH-quinone oxidoreductase subunit C [Pyrinomonadaceae bacterium]